VIGSLFSGVHDFFHSQTWYVTWTVAVGFVLVLWVATIFWVFKDAKRRIRNPLLVFLATLVGAVPPFLGPFVYMLFRPPEYLADRHERELEIRAIERRLDERAEQCFVCGAEVDTDFLVCPVCTTRLRQACASCHRPLEPAWQVCPYCETPVVSEPMTLGAEPVTLATTLPPRRTTQSRTPG
jgi:RNA polymerase subunit RPABC4/transcription elongation factor Spt4